ncbi:SRPBCC domain-containing protein [Sinomicrobium weinanense]
MKTILILLSVFLLAIPHNERGRTRENKTTVKPLKQNDMENRDYTAAIVVNETPETAFNYIKDIRAWWSEEIEGPTDQLNKTFFYHYKDIHLCKIKLVEIDKNKKLVYQVLENEFNFIEDKTEWVDTQLIFDITKEGGKTTITFTHKGLVPDYECYDVCRDGWAQYIKTSLYNLITTGKGDPNPKDKEGFNAELAKRWKLD